MKSYLVNKSTPLRANSANNQEHHHQSLLYLPRPVCQTASEHLAYGTNSSIIYM